MKWLVAMWPGEQQALDIIRPLGRLLNELGRPKARIRAKVENPFRVVKCQFGPTKAFYRGLMKMTQKLITLFALSNL